MDAVTKRQSGSQASQRHVPLGGPPGLGRVTHQTCSILRPGVLPCVGYSNDEKKENASENGEKHGTEKGVLLNLLARRGRQGVMVREADDLSFAFETTPDYGYSYNKYIQWVSSSSGQKLDYLLSPG